MALPIIEVPFFDLSLSAPIFFLLTTYVVFRSPRGWTKPIRFWIILAAFLWAGVFLSAMLNGLLSGGTNINTNGILTVLRYAYWLLVFIVTLYIASQPGLLQRMVNWLGWGVFILATMRWLEILVFGNFGAWSGTRFMTQNSYGFLFSMFSPFLLIRIVQEQGSKRFWAVISNLLLWGAVAINGSRSSWISIGIGIASLLIFLALSQPKKFAGIAIILVIFFSLGSLIVSSTPAMRDPIVARFNTMDELDNDKSYQIRVLMNQKALRLFQASPIIGVGAGRFTVSSIPLDIPAVLNYAHQEHLDRKSAHNSYLSFLAENGLLGSIPFLILLLTLSIGGGIASFRGMKENQFFNLAVFLGFIQMSIHMWAISSLTNTANWFVYGLTAAVVLLWKQQNTLTKGELNK